MKTDYRSEDGKCTATNRTEIKECNGWKFIGYCLCCWLEPFKGNVCTRPHPENEGALYIESALHGSVHNELGEPKRVDKKKFRKENEDSK